MRRHSIIAITFLLFAITGYYAVPLEEEIKNATAATLTEDATTTKKPVIEVSSSSPISDSTTAAPSTTEKIVEIVLETSSTSSTSVKSEIPTSRTTKAPKTTQKTRKTTQKPSSFKQPNTRQEWLKLIQDEMAAYDKKSGSSTITNKNLTIISERILKYLVENGTSIGISLREQKDGTIKYTKSNSTSDKIYGDGTESKFPPVLEFVVQRIQSYFSVYAMEDTSRPSAAELQAEREKNSSDLPATLREEPDDDDDDDDDEDEESSTLTNDQVIDQLQDELSEFIGSEAVKNVTDIKLPSLIKTAYEKFSSWFAPTISAKPAAKEEPVAESSSEEDTNTTSTTSNKKPTKKPSLMSGAYDALEAILSVFDDIDVSDEDEKSETSEKPSTEDGPQLKESQDDLEETEIKETVGENLYDFLKLAYTLYEDDES
ncbi:uncharacterized protein LOC134829109 [Culicoides brevitarsis]|uniref:uncharacterized protein LOC134829109 n=1 Tax=Culicoides brevitarsis TaxID=469753 RepID=UPI00307BF6FD